MILIFLNTDADVFEYEIFFSQLEIGCANYPTFHRIIKVGKHLQDHPVQLSTYHQYFPTKPYLYNVNKPTA